MKVFANHPRFSLLPLVCFTLWACGTLFATSDLFVNAETTPKWYAFFYGLSLILIGSVIPKKPDNTQAYNHTSLIFAIIAVLCLMQATYGVLQFFDILPTYKNFRVTGSFNNPAGFAVCLCSGFPFAIYFFSRQKQLKLYALIAGAVIGLAVILSYSRAGMISLAVLIGCFFLIRIKTRHKKRLVFLLLVLIGALLIGLHFVKKDSANGRLLIWRCSWEMIQDKPLLGHGPGGFEARYMNYQANYFGKHPDSPYALLADQVNHPFNEYVLLAVNYGLLGVTILIGLSILLLRQYRKRYRQDGQVRIAGLSLLSISIFALFSYPFSYPFIWIISMLCIWVIMGKPRIISYLSRSIALALAAIVIFLTYKDMRLELRWGRASREMQKGNIGKALPEYKVLHEKFGKNRYFLYNYMYELSLLGKLNESIVVAEECERIWANYYLQLVLADTYQKVQQYSEAEHRFKLAAVMCPPRFIPLYKLAQIYLASGRPDEACEVAQSILGKEVKIPSSIVNSIKHEMRQLVDSLQPSPIPMLAPANQVITPGLPIR